MENELPEKSQAHLILKRKAQIGSTMTNREESINPWAAVFEKFYKRPRSSATTPKVKRSKVQKKVTNKNPERILRLKRSTIDSKSLAFEQAKEVQANLSNHFPSLIKYMLRSHTASGFWLGLPKDFCEVHMPRFDTIIVLEDENGREYITKYLFERTGLSGGWRGFSIAHKLLEGDVLVFHLIQHYKFKVYIIRSHGSKVVDVVPGLHFDGHMKSHDSENDPVNTRISDADTLPSDQTFLNVPPEYYPSNNTMISDAHILSSDEHGNTSNLDENLGSQVLNEIRLSKSTATFQQVTSIENFRIVVDGLVVDSELSRHLKTKYYELCCSQGMFLHENLIKGQDGKLVVAMICETINIADAIRASKITTSSDSFAMWHKSLKGLKVLGMNVSFLLARLEQLMSLDSKAKSKFFRYTEIRIEQDQAEKEKKGLELKLQEVKRTISRLDGEIDSQNQELESLEAGFQVLANTLY